MGEIPRELESHYEYEFPDRVRGRVTGIYQVTHDVIERRTLRRPGHGAPADAVMPADGEEWPLIGRTLANGVFVGTRLSRYMIETVPVPDTTALEPAPRVGGKTDAVGASPSARPADPPPERRRRVSPGWAVDVDDVERHTV